MTKELAIKILTGDILGTSEQTQEAVTMAVKALETMQNRDFERWEKERQARRERRKKINL